MMISLLLPRISTVDRLTDICILDVIICMQKAERGGNSWQ